jgi:hypothetical protein
MVPGGSTASEGLTALALKLRQTCALDAELVKQEAAFMEREARAGRIGRYVLSTMVRGNLPTIHVQPPNLCSLHPLTIRGY